MKILYVVHNGFWNEFTGTPLIARQYIQFALQRNWEVALMVPEDVGTAAFGVGDAFSRLKVLQWPVMANWPMDAYQDLPATNESSRNIGAEFAPDIVHIIDWVNIHPSVLVALKELRVPILRHVWNMEDICAFISPIRFQPDHSACEFPLPAGQCGVCYARTMPVNIQGYQGTLGDLKGMIDRDFAGLVNAYAGAIDNKWRTFQRQQGLFDHLIFPCESFRAYFESAAHIQIPVSVIEHGLPASDKRPAKIREGGCLNLVFLGGLEERKGWPAVEAAVEKMLNTNHRERINLRVYGALGTNGYVGKLAAYPQVQFLGRFAPAELEHILAWADVGILPTHFETYCRVVREFILNGVVPVASKAFGIPDVIQDGFNGILLDRPHDAALLSAIERLLTVDGLLDILREGVLHTKVVSDSAEYAKLETLYKLEISKSRSAK